MNNKTTACAIAVLGRLPLVRETVNRMKYKNKVDYIVCVCSNDEDAHFCAQLPCVVVMHPNHPLGSKWNSGWKHLFINYNPDYYIFAGSSDWLSDNWIEGCLPYLDTYDAVGKLDMYLFDLGQTQNRLCHWPGYTGDRAGDTIGIGRMLTKNIVEKMRGLPFHPELDSGLDWSMTLHIASLGGILHTIEGDEIKSLSLSCYQWGNKHQFEQHWDNELPSVKIEPYQKFMDQHFPEYKIIKL